ncbi:hypothetical protein [Pseudooceanicola sp.]|uniref:hypothetical protein n=1 Tax=Pseudooceanicola sp. TaxID=1914328 RepID=UPI0035176478
MNSQDTDTLAWIRRVENRLMEICDEEGIPRPEGPLSDASSWYKLAVVLASRHEAGLKPHVKAPGAPVTNEQRLKDFELFANVAFALYNGKNVSEAIRALTLKGRIFEGQSFQGLRQRYYTLLRGASESERVRESFEMFFEAVTGEKASFPSPSEIIKKSKNQL